MAVNRVFSLTNHNRSKQTPELPRHQDVDPEQQQQSPHQYHPDDITSLPSLSSHSPSSQQPHPRFTFPEGFEDEFEMSIFSSSNPDDSSQRSALNRLITSNAAYTNDLNIKPRSTPQKLFTLPKKLFKYIYSVSSVIFALLTLGFVAVTPLDVIVQTSGTSFSGIKMFIVIIVCVVFLFLSTVLYLSRIVQYKSHMNEIPTYSVYIPDENDYPKSVYSEIDRELRLCIGDIRLKAGPLFNSSAVINHPGVSPPHYIQVSYKQGEAGTLFPPETIYEDIIRSLGDKFIYDSKAFTQTDLPNYFTFREIMLYLGQVYNIKGPSRDPNEPDLPLIIQLYEKFRFSDTLIQEQDLFQFMIEFDKLGQMWHGNYQSNIAVPSSTFHKRRKSSTKSVDFDTLAPDANYLQPNSGSSYRRSSSALAFDEEYNLYEEDDDYNYVGDYEREGESIARNRDGEYREGMEDEEYQFYHQNPENEFFSKIEDEDDEEEKSSLNSVKITKDNESRRKYNSGGSKISLNSSRSNLKANSQFLMTPIISISKTGNRSDNASINSSRSVVRNKLAMDGNFRKLSRSRSRSINDDANSLESSNSVVRSKKSNSNSVSVTPAASYLNLKYDGPASMKRNSGYMTDSEHERDDEDDNYSSQDRVYIRNNSTNSNNDNNNNINEDNNGDEEMDFYQFRSRNKSS
ncbi:hypothetical protein DFJ63DRAFT_144359 [Scheffersomyces coipomensis]|uniref:uncharacterized protein n=1 Tax=Scheffersomyces coipomensis TaxID=1788519 RepID=UPI00315CA5F9